MKSKNVVVICYFSAGTSELWRDDAAEFPEEALGNPLEAWNDEVWVDVNNEAVRDVMSARIAMAATKGCDGVEPDNTQVYLEEETGVSVTAAQQLDYSIFLAAEAHANDLSIGLKNDIPHLEDLEPYFDWALNESCMEYEECDGYTTSFIAANKAVFHTEYEWSDLTFCDEANKLQLSSLLKSWELGPARCSCQDPSTNNQCEHLLETGTESTSFTLSTSSDTPSPTPPPSEEDTKEKGESSGTGAAVRGWFVIGRGGGWRQRLAPLLLGSVGAAVVVMSEMVFAAVV